MSYYPPSSEAVHQEPQLHPSAQIELLEGEPAVQAIEEDEENIQQAEEEHCEAGEVFIQELPVVMAGNPHAALVANHYNELKSFTSNKCDKFEIITVIDMTVNSTDLLQDSGIHAVGNDNLLGSGIH